MATGFGKYPAGHNGEIDRYMMNVILLCEAMTRQSVKVRTLTDPGYGAFEQTYEFYFEHDRASVSVGMSQEKRESIPSEIIARDIVAKLRGHTDGEVLHSVGGIVDGPAGRKNRDMAAACTPGPIQEKKRARLKKAQAVYAKDGSKDALAYGIKAIKDMVKATELKLPPPPEYQKELQGRLNNWLN